MYVPALALVAAAIVSATSAAGPQTKTFHPKPSDKPLLNPGMGVYIFVGRNTRLPENTWLKDVCAIAYTRLHWCDLEPAPGQYKFDEYFKPMLDYFVGQLGWRIAFRVMSESMHGRTKYVTPKWVFDAGVPGVKHVGIGGIEQIDPVFWDPKYLDLQCRFIKALGQWVESQRGIEFVDIGSIGEWGEMHLGLHIPGRWTPEQLRETGYSDYKYIMAYRRIIDAFADAFPHTRVFLGVGPFKEIDYYAAMRGIHFRQDGLGLIGASADVDKWLFPEYAFRGIQCNLELITGWEGMKRRGWDPREVIRTGLKARISYLNLNFGWGVVTNPPPEVRQAIMEAARRIGYRFRCTEVELITPVHVRPRTPSRLVVRHKWTNEGVAPCYESLAMEWVVLDSSGRQVASTRSFPKLPTTHWLPGESISDGCIVDLPVGFKPGHYTLAVRMFLPEKPQQRYYLAMAGGSDGLYPVAEFDAVAGSPPKTTVATIDFESPEDFRRVGVPKGITKQLVPDKGLDGSHALHISGSCENTWSYALLRRLPLIPGARYRLEGWLNVTTCQGAAKPPYFKVGLNDATGKCLYNANTQRYDMRRAGQWQKLSVDFDVPATATTGDIAIERGQKTGRITVDMLVDRVSLTLLAAP